jgi:hypothetical protein
MDSHPFNPDARALEEAFFARENARLLERLREKAAREKRREELRRVIRNADDALLDHLSELGVGPETALAVVLVPLAVVAWADGSIDARERRAIVTAAEERGFAPGSTGHALIESWLETKPGPELIETWRRYVRAIWGELSAGECDDLRRRVLGFARSVAESAGGFLGLG